MSARPSILFVAAFGAGLATGLLRFQAPLLAVAVVLAGLTWARRGGLPALCAAAALLGGLEGDLAWHAERQSCAAVLPAASLRLRVRLAEPVDSAGGQVLVRPVGAGCRGAVSARWPARQAHDAGAEATVTARWVPRPRWTGRPDGTLVVSAARAADARPTLSERIRTWTARGSARLYGSRAGLVEALVVGRRVGMERTLQDRFAQSGLVHLLSISGFHVGLVAAWVVLACRLCRMRRTRALAAAALVATGYVAFLGW